jgi:hemoglobin
MRHMPFVIGPAERDAWLRHMDDAVTHMVSESRLTESDAAELWDYLTMAAGQLVNAP